jgi:hypothetical protein
MLELHVYRLHLRGSAAARNLPPLAVWRSAWGAALRRLACSTGAAQCTGCPVAERCAYRLIFDPLPPQAHALGTLSAVPPAYVLGRIEGAPQGGTLDFTLLGPAQERLGLVLASLSDAMKQGLGKARVTLEPDRLEYLTQGQWRMLRSDQPRLPSLRLEPDPSLQHVERRDVLIELQSPVRLQDQGRIIGTETFTPRRWLIALLRRIGLLADLYGTPLRLDFPGFAALADQVTMSDARIRWVDDARWSSRQRKSHPMGGVTGRFRMSGPISPFLPFLRAGLWLNCGKHAAFGQGSYRLFEAPASLI